MSDLNTAAVQPASNVVHIVAQQQSSEQPKSTKQSLDKSKRTSKKDQAYASVGQLMSCAGETIGHYTVEKDLLQSDTLAAVQSYLNDAMQQGLDEEMLRAPSASRTGEAYTCLVTALQETRIAAGMDVLKDSTRDNYMSRIRAYVRDRGANPLDLFGNLKVKAQRAALKAQATKNADGQTEAERATEHHVSPSAQSGTAESMIGLPALHKFLEAWVGANENKVIGKYVDMAKDLDKALVAALASAQKAK